MSSGQWEALPQRSRKRRPTTAAAAAAAAAPATQTGLPPYPPPHQHRHQQQQQPDTTWPPAPTPTPPSGATAARATAARASGDPKHHPPAAAVHSSSNGEASRGGTGSGSRDARDRTHPQQHPKQPRGNSSSAAADGIGATAPAGGNRKAERAPNSGGTGGGGLAGSAPGSASPEPASTAPAPTAEASLPAGGGSAGDTTQGGQVRGQGDGGGGGQQRRGAAGVTAPDAETVAARHAAVATAVEARSKMTRFAGGLDGGAGADGGSAGANFEYLDHTADVQLHSWGDSIERAMEGALAAMFNTITDIAKVDVDPSATREMEIEGHDAKSLLFSLLDEFLFLFHSEGLAVKRTTVNGTIDREGGPTPRWRLRATAEGETFDLAKHPQGTEVKAITYSNMQINEAPDGRTDIYVIVDI